MRIAGWRTSWYMAYSMTDSIPHVKACKAKQLHHVRIQSFFHRPCCKIPYNQYSFIINPLATYDYALCKTIKLICHCTVELWNRHAVLRHLKYLKTVSLLIRMVLKGLKKLNWTTQGNISMHNNRAKITVSVVGSYWSMWLVFPILYFIIKKIHTSPSAAQNSALSQWVWKSSDKP